jgi:hypothetical protein
LLEITDSFPRLILLGSFTVMYMGHMGLDTWHIL